jgi:hypothetical protein
MYLDNVCLFFMFYFGSLVTFASCTKERQMNIQLKYGTRYLVIL